MYPPEFEYYHAESVDEALELIAEHGVENVDLMSGGHSLLPTMKVGLADPEIIVDISSIDSIEGIEAEEGALQFGALTTYATITNSERAWEATPAVAEAAGEIGDIQVRNRGTIGGNIAHSDPSSDLPAAVLASGGTITARGPDGTREIDIEDFFEGIYTTALEGDEILTHVTVPTLSEGGAGAYTKKPNPASGYALVGVAAVLEVSDNVIDAARVAANGALDHASRLEGVEEALTGAEIDEGIAESAAESATDGIESYRFLDDLHASSEFRAQLLEVYTKESIETALERADESSISA